MKGIMVKKSGDKTIKVAIKKTKLHKIYNKTVLNTYTYQVHDEYNEYKIGEEVSFVFCRKLSTSKNSYAIKKIKNN